MKKTIMMITLFFTLMFAVTGFAAPANADDRTPDEDGWLGVPYAYPSTPPAPENNLSQEDLWVAAAQYTARDSFSAVHALGAGDYTVLNMDVPAEGVASDLSNGTCPGPIRYTDTTVPNQEFIAELGECGGWERYGWLQEGNVVRLSGKVEGNYMVHDVMALGDPNNAKSSFTDVPDVVMMVNNANEKNELYLFGLIDYTQRVDNVPLA
ncbi:MAG: hypothetical protein H9W81_07540 [Enterococcus sp.]|nr:hypothetical protein [Enterococcus sp.]